MEPTT